MRPTGGVEDPLITTFGRFVEVHAALGQGLGRALEQQCGISHSWFEVLLRIGRADSGRVSMGVLAQQVALTTGGITRMVDRMITAGLVHRQTSPTDRRVQLAELTEAGKAKLDAAAAVHAANLRVAFTDFSQRDLTTLDDLLDRLRNARHTFGQRG